MFNPEELSKRFTEKGIRPECPVCGANNFAPVTNPLLVPFFEGGNFSIPPQGITLGALLCKNCTYVMFFGHNTKN